MRVESVSRTHKNVWKASWFVKWKQNTQGSDLEEFWKRHRLIVVWNEFFFSLSGVFLLETCMSFPFVVITSRLSDYFKLTCVSFHFVVITSRLSDYFKLTCMSFPFVVIISRLSGYFKLTCMFFPFVVIIYRLSGYFQFFS